MIILPPVRWYVRDRSWETFERLYDPVVREDGSLLFDLHGDLPDEVDHRHVWTVVDCDGRLLLTAGYAFVNRFAYVLCRKAWGGQAHEHPDYRYD